MGSLIVSLALTFLVCGIAYGRAAGTMRSAGDAIAAIQKSIGTLAGLILLMLIISQFIAIFNESNMATLAAVSLAEFLGQLNLPTVALLIGLVFAAFGIDLIITAAIAKWAIFAPVFMPLLMQPGVAPETDLAAYRVGDSPMNSITPLNACFAMIVTFAIKYQKDAGVGTLIALMLPCVVAISVAWTLLLAAWYLLGLPWGL
jgi:aminobenzoyl-glutamate transport protein